MDRGMDGHADGQMDGWRHSQYPHHFFKLEAQVAQKLLTWIRLIMICYSVLWWPS